MARNPRSNGATPQRDEKAVTGCGADAGRGAVAQLALYHLVPVPANALAEKMFARGLARIFHQAAC